MNRKQLKAASGDGHKWFSGRIIRSEAALDKMLLCE
jgi:hypothetical protein